MTEPNLPTLQFPTIDIATPVKVCRTPDWTDPTIGWVSSVSDRCCDIAAIVNGQLYIFREAVHRTDPRCKTMPEEFQEADGIGVGGAIGGVFELATVEVQARRTVEQIAALQRAMQTHVVERAELLKRIEVLEQASRPKAEEQAPPPRPVGRPRGSTNQQKDAG
jgi:hypothetical protein